MGIHKFRYYFVQSLVLFFAVVGLVTMFTNLSFNNGPVVVRADVCELQYEPTTKTLTIEPGDLPRNFPDMANARNAENIIFVSTTDSAQKVVAPVDCYQMFSQLTNLKRMLGTQNFDTSNAQWMDKMFEGCSNLTTLDLSSWDTSNTTNMVYMFRNCTSLTNLNLSSLDASKVIDMGHMFYNCTSLSTLNLSDFQTSNLQIMYFMFYNCSSLKTLDLSSFDTSKVNTMVYTFYNCQSLTTLNLGSFNTANVTDMTDTFANCSRLTELDLTAFNTAKVTSMYNLFSGMSAMWKLTLGPACMIQSSSNLPTPVIGTLFNQYKPVTSDKWLQQTTGVEYTAEDIYTAHLLGNTDTYVWQSEYTSTVEYTVEPSYMITIPAKITIPSATLAGTEQIGLSAYPKLPFDQRFIHIFASSNGTPGWHLTSAGDSTGAAYHLGTTSGGNEFETADEELTFTADGEAPAQNHAIYAQLADSTHKFKYAGTYLDTVTFTIQTAAS